MKFRGLKIEKITTPPRGHQKSTVFLKPSLKPQFAISTLNADWSYQDDVLEHLAGRMF